MKSTRAQAALNKERLLDVGSQRFREQGYAGIGIVDLMREVGQTHGAFYGNFASKEDFIAEACTRGYDQTLQSWPAVAKAVSESSGSSLLESLVTAYLSEAHRDDPAHGCVTVALSADAVRQGTAVQQATADGIERILELIASAMPDGPAHLRRAGAIQTYASLVGAMTMARAAGASPLSSEILSAVTKGLLANAAPAKKGPRR